MKRRRETKREHRNFGYTAERTRSRNIPKLTGSRGGIRI